MEAQTLKAASSGCRQSSELGSRAPSVETHFTSLVLRVLTKPHVQALPYLLYHSSQAVGCWHHTTTEVWTGEATAPRTCSWDVWESGQCPTLREGSTTPCSLLSPLVQLEQGRDDQRGPSLSRARRKYQNPWCLTA